MIWHHYDAVHRIRHGMAAGRGAALAGLGGFEVRIVAIAALAAAGSTAYTVGIAAATGLLAVLAVVRGVDLVRRSPAAVGRPAGGNGDT